MRIFILDKRIYKMNLFVSLIFYHCQINTEGYVQIEMRNRGADKGQKPSNFANMFHKWKQETDFVRTQIRKRFIKASERQKCKT